MYLGETDTQTESMNTVCIEIIQSMEETMSSITAFTLAFSLQGEAYRSAKAFMAGTYLPLAQGIIYLCEELIRQNDKYPSDFRSQVATSDVIEQEVVAQINEIDRMITSYETLNKVTPMFSIMILIYKHMRQKLQEKLENLYLFNSASKANYDTALQLAQNVMLGLSQLQDGNGFNSKTGTFSTEGMDLSWIQKLDEIHYTRKAKDKYGDYLKKYPEDIDKVITIIKYEERDPEYIEQTDEFLSVLDAKDRTEIKYLMYTAEEPYRTLAMKYLDRLELILVEINPDDDEEPGPSFFSPSENSITYVFEKDRTNGRGAYFTIFHEIAHAIDYNYGYDVDGGFFQDIKEFFGYYDYYSETFEVEGKTLTDNMYIDFENKIKNALKIELNSSIYDHLSTKDKTIMVNNITENLLNQDKNFEKLSDDERELQMLIENNFSVELTGPDHSVVSDVYGGVTNFTIEGSYGHEDDYWFKNGKRIREPNREGFAEYFARLITKDKDGVNPGIESVEKFLPSSKKHMDKMIESMDGK